MTAALLPDAVFRYDDRGDALVDVHLPTDGATRAPVVFLIHGGFWKQAYDRTHTRDLARALANDGFVVLTPEYRRVGAGGGWPITCDDVLSAATSIPTLLDALGITASTVSITGHSAGGHLALWLAGKVPADAIVPLAPVCDLAQAARRHLGSGAVQAFIGTDDIPAEADPMQSLSPGTPVHVLHGIADDTVPIDLSRGLVEAHPWVALTELPIGHFEVLDPRHSSYAEIRAALARSSP